jgi:hypothetical protein
MEDSEFKNLIEGYGFDSSEVYRDISEQGFMIYLDKDEQFSVSIESHVSSNNPMLIFSSMIREKYVQSCTSLNSIDRLTIQELNSYLKSGSYSLTKKGIFSNKLKLVVTSAQGNEYYSAILS